jgi:hypothetical protein
MLPIIYIIPVGWKDFVLHRGGALVGAASCFLVKASGFWSSGLPALFYGDVEEEDDGRWVIFSKNVKVCGCGAKVCHVLNSQHSKKYNKKKEYSPTCECCRLLWLEGMSFFF